jgi:hypothetical protein
VVGDGVGDGVGVGVGVGVGIGGVVVITQTVMHSTCFA